MVDELKPNRPWMVAVWPGMGQVAISAGYYLMAKLGMHQLAEFDAEELFDADHVEVKGGLIRPPALPRSRMFVWRDPKDVRDIVVFIGEAQPPTGKREFCRRLIERAEAIGVERVFTFAAMATDLQPTQESRVFGAATDDPGIEEFKRLELELLDEGHISGLNGVLLGTAAQRGMRGACLLGEMPHVLVQLPYPKASLAVLEVFSIITGINLDLDELREQTRQYGAQLEELVSRLQRPVDSEQTPGEHVEEESWEPETFTPEPEEHKLDPENRARVEELFEEAAHDRSKAYELKRVLDEHGVFEQYEDRFLDLFQSPGDEATGGD